MSCGPDQIHPNPVSNHDVGDDSGATDTISDVVPQEGVQAGSVGGDWFICEDEACTKPTYKGFRLGTDNLYRELFAVPPYLEPSELYCYIASEIQT